MFPPKPGPQAQGAKLKNVGFRPRVDQRAYLDLMKERGHSHSKVLSTAVDILIEADKELGREIKLLEGLAEMEGISLGVAWARAMKLGLPQLTERLAKRTPPE